MTEKRTFFNTESQLLLGQALGQFGSSLLSFVLGLYILRTISSAFLYSLSQVIGPIVAVILLPILGSIVDRYNKKKVILFSQFASCAALFVFALLNSTGGFDYIGVLFLLVVLKISDQFLTTSLTASTILIVEEDRVQTFKAHLQMIQSISMLISPFVAVFLYQLFSLSVLVLLEFLIELVVLLLFSKVRFSQKINREDHPENQSLLALFQEGVGFIFSYNKLIFGLIFVLLLNFVLGIVNVGLPYVQIHQLQFSNINLAVNDSLLAFGLLLGAFVLTKLNIHSYLSIANKMVIGIGTVTLVLGIFLTFSFPKYGWIFVLGFYFFLIGLLITICNILISSWSMKHIPEQLQGRIFAILNTVTQVSLPVSMLLVGYLMQSISSYYLFIGAGILILIITLIVPNLFGINLTSNELE